MSVDLPDTEKCLVLSTFMRKLQKSGYGLGLRQNILQVAMKTYRNKLRADHLGIRPLHRLGGFDAANRRRKKISSRETWFKKDPNNWKRKLSEEEERLREEESPNNPKSGENRPHRGGVENTTQMREVMLL